jgi:hypothetical protein
MAQQRSLPEKVQDIKSTYEQFKELLTTPEMLALMQGMTGPEAQQAVALTGDVKLLVQVVHASMDLQKVISANDRAALIAAVAAVTGTRPSLTEDPEV